LLAHTQAEFPRLIQVSDLAGGFILSFVIMLVAACITATFQIQGAWVSRSETQLWWPIAVAGSALAATLGYGHWRLGQTPPGAAGSTAHVALIQGSLDTVFEEPTAQRIQEIFDHHRKLTTEAVQRKPNLDLVAWPESALALSETVFQEPLEPQH